MKLTKSPAGRSLKVFASSTGIFAGAVLFLGLLEFLAFVWKEGDVIKDFFGAIYVVIMFVICLGALLYMTIAGIVTYIYVCKEKQKKFLLFALPAQIIASILLFLSLIFVFKGLQQQELIVKKIGCWLNIIAGIIGIYLTVISIVFKHIAWNKARKAE